MANKGFFAFLTQTPVLIAEQGLMSKTGDAAHPRQS